MSNFTTKLAAAGYLVLAAVPAAAGMAAVAHARPAGVSVQIGDIDFATAAGQKTFEARVETAGRTFCGDERSITARDACMTGVKAEAQDKLARVMAARASHPTTLAAR